jgi:hypothetical protein
MENIFIYIYEYIKYMPILISKKISLIKKGLKYLYNS